MEPAKVYFGEVLRELFMEMFWYGDGVFLMDTEHFRRRLLSNIGRYRGGGRKGGREGEASIRVFVGTEYSVFPSCPSLLPGNYTFQEAFDRTGRILNIIVAPANNSDPPRLLNYLTSPHVLVWSAAAVSSAAPGIFEPGTCMCVCMCMHVGVCVCVGVWVYVYITPPPPNKTNETKSPIQPPTPCRFLLCLPPSSTGYLYVRQADGSERPESSCKWYDGSVEKDLPMEQLAELFNINHFLVSQVNPQATLFSSVTLPQTILSSPLLTVFAHIMQFCKRQFRSWCRNFFKLIEASRRQGKPSRPFLPPSLLPSSSLLLLFPTDAIDVRIFPPFPLSSHTFPQPLSLSRTYTIQ